MIIDLHTHTAERSPCSLSCEDAMIQSAIDHGLGAIAITDHHKLVPLDRLEALNEKYAPFKIFGGVEVYVHNETQTQNEDIVVLGVSDPEIERRDWQYPDFVKFVRDHDGFFWLAHPYRYGNTVGLDIDTYVPDAIEVHSSNIGACDETMILETIQRLGSQAIQTSDAHLDTLVGIYAIETDRTIETEADLLTMLRAGDYRPHADEARIAPYNADVEQYESVIRDMISHGHDVDHYVETTGNWSGRFNRVALGKSYKI